ncbi:MAG: hypothetical protein Q7W02_02420 [Candidatus Rokubacteria bacterium]|nr:hypothetical protein [Candidatus Rokubacteria bacterium]
MARSRQKQAEARRAGDQGLRAALERVAEELAGIIGRLRNPLDTN